jgi:hypothetical protein
MELFLAPKVQEPALFHLPAGCGIVPFILESLIFHSRRVFSCDPGSKFHVVTNIRQASVTDEIGIVCLELQGGQPFLQGQDNIHQHFGMAAGQGQESQKEIIFSLSPGLQSVIITATSSEKRG